MTSPAKINPAQLMTFDDLLKEGVTQISDITGQPSLVEKDSLIGVPFVVIDCTLHPGFNEQQYCNVQVITQKNERLCFNDGGVGIYPVVEIWNAEHPNSLGMYCPRGLRKSDYTNDHGPATTYYFS